MSLTNCDLNIGICYKNKIHNIHNLNAINEKNGDFSLCDNITR